MMRGFLLAILVVLLPICASAAPDRRALVVGNDSYAHLPMLGKARNDARAVADTLGGLGFSVAHLADGDRRAMTRAVSDLANAIQPGDEVLFYFAGHGVEISGRNYLLPTDAPAATPGDEAFLTAESLAVDDILATLQDRGARVTVLMLDACRDNPFPKMGTRSTGGSRGLAPIAAPEGAFILFSAGTGQSALDGLNAADRDPNSVFTRALLPLLQVPGMPIQSIARALKAEVEATAAGVNHKQRPAYYDELTGDFVLNAGALRGAAALDDSTALTAPDLSRASPPDPCDAAARDWQTVAGLSDAAILRSFAATHSGCDVFSHAAAERAAQIEAAQVAATPAQPAVVIPTWRVKAGVSEGYMNARTGPGTMHTTLFRIPERMGGLVVADCRRADPGGGKGDWCLVTADGQQGWVSKLGLEPE